MFGISIGNEAHERLSLIFFCCLVLIIEASTCVNSIASHTYVNLRKSSNIYRKYRIIRS